MVKSIDALEKWKRNGKLGTGILIQVKDPDKYRRLTPEEVFELYKDIFTGKSVTVNILKSMYEG